MTFFYEAILVVVTGVERRRWLREGLTKNAVDKCRLVEGALALGQ